MKGIRRTIRRRRKEAKTDYVARLGMLKSKKPRIVVRRTNQYIVAQLTSSRLAQDKVDIAVSSKDLIAQGWPAKLHGSLKGLAAAYLTGKLLASKMPKGADVIVDFGMQRNHAGGRLAAVVKGLVDGGVAVKHAANWLPDEKRLESNKNTREVYLKLKEGFKK